MAYISNEDVKEIRNNIKKAFPIKEGWKFSIRRLNHSEVNVAIMQSPKSHGFEGDEQVNQYYIDEHYKDLPLQREMLSKLNDIIKEKWWDESDSQSDYFHCAYYYTIHIGKWNKDCVSV